MNEIIEPGAITRLKKVERRAQELALLRSANERMWQKAYDVARKSPAWKEYCATNNICERYDYGDVIC